MEVRDLYVEVQDVNLTKVGTITPTFLDLQVTIRDRQVGEWSLRLPVNHPMAQALRVPGAGILVAVRGEVAFSGPMTTPLKVLNREYPTGMYTFSGISDDVLGEDALAWPDPSNTDPGAQSQANDTRTGVAESLMKAYVSDNIGPTAPAARRGLLAQNLAIETDQARGFTTKRSPRFQNLLALLQDIGTYSNLGFRFVRPGNGTVEFQVYEFTDRSDEVVLDINSGTLESQESVITGPSSTRSIVAGQGEGTARTIIQRTTADATAAEGEWGRVIESFIDQRQTDDATELEQAGDEPLLAGGFTSTSVRAVAADNQRMEFMTDWRVGDTIGVIADGVRSSAVATAAAIIANKDGVKVGVSIGDATEFDEGAKAQSNTNNLNSRVSNLEQSDTVGGAGGSTPVGAVSMFSGPAAPSGWLLCDGAAVSRTTYAALFAVVGTTYGAGNGSTTFNVPNLKGRVPVGLNPADGNFGVLGETGGAKTHTLTTTEMPSHTHIQNAHSHGVTDPGHNHTQNAHTHAQNAHNHGVTDPGHNHTQNSHNHTQNQHRHAASDEAGLSKALSNTTSNAEPFAASGSNAYRRTANLSDTNTSYTTATNNATTATNNANTTGLTVNNTTATNQNTTATNNSATTGVTLASATAVNQSAGGGGAHNNLQPYIVLNYIIKA